jgi:DNA polymerase-4/DNA polymerase V
MRLFEVRQICPDAVILPSDYETYSLFSERMYAIVRRYTPDVEEYSIDECFADLTGLRRNLRMSYPQIAEQIKKQLDHELGMTFSIGVSATKTLAKVGSKWQKPSGLTIIPLREAPAYLKAIKVDAVWGIGPQTSALLNKYGIRTAYDFANKDEAWIKVHVSKPYFETWQELNGIVANELNLTGRETYQSISKTKTFTPPSNDPAFVYAQLSKNVENACIKARRWKLSTPLVFFFLKTQDFRYSGYEVKLPFPTSNPLDILREIHKYFSRVCKKGVQYRATGVTLINLTEEGTAQLDLFGHVKDSEAIKRVFESTDKLAERYGKHVVFLGSSFEAMSHAAHLGERGDVAARTLTLFKGETARRRLAIPMLGEVV